MAAPNDYEKVKAERDELLKAVERLASPAAFTYRQSMANGSELMLRIEYARDVLAKVRGAPAPA